MSNVESLIPWQESVQEELNDLTQKLTRLRSFMATPAFRSLLSRQRTLLTSQSNYMFSYADCLIERLQDEQG